MDIDISIDDKIVIVIDIVKELVSGEDFASVIHEPAQNSEFRESELNRLVPFAQNIRLNIEEKIAKSHRLVRFFRLFASTEDRLDAGEENFWGKGLLHIVVSA